MMNRYVLGPLLRRIKGRRFDATDDTYQPTVTVVFPLFNEGEGIHHTVRTLLEQDYPRAHEIVVVDDCSSDDSYAWACKAAEGTPT